MGSKGRTQGMGHVGTEPQHGKKRLEDGGVKKKGRRGEGGLLQQAGTGEGKEGSLEEGSGWLFSCPIPCKSVGGLEPNKSLTKAY